VKVDGRELRTIWASPENANTVLIVDQTDLPHRSTVRPLRDVEEVAEAIRAMRVRGAPLIGVAAAYGLWLALVEDASDEAFAHATSRLHATRPTAVNLQWALTRVRDAILPLPKAQRAGAARKLADAMAEEDVAVCAAIGRAGLEVLREVLAAKRARGSNEPLQILTHCNAGWLATVDWGTATAPIYMAHAAGLPVHVWVDETRPRNQGASLTAWELGKAGVPYTLIVDNAGGHIMQHGKVDLCIVGTDRTTARGDVCNKIGTYLKALAAHDNGVPFFVAAPSSSIDFTKDDGVASIPIEERSPLEVTRVAGRDASGAVVEVDIAAPGAAVHNPAFDVTPARLVTGLFTERGRCAATREAIAAMFPERVVRPA
jgi:methylthioribose-1-phosphate isomerase